MGAQKPAGGRGKTTFYSSYVCRIPAPLLAEVERLKEQFYRDIEHAHSLPLSGPWWAVLGVTETASNNEIKTAYRLLARIFHPDMTDKKMTSERFTAINKAYREYKERDNRNDSHSNSR